MHARGRASFAPLKGRGGIVEAGPCTRPKDAVTANEVVGFGYFGEAALTAPQKLAERRGGIVVGIYMHEPECEAICAIAECNGEATNQPRKSKLMRSTFLAATLVASLFAISANASHNNPWAVPGDDVNAKNHDTNQAYSADRPGEDEMHGVENSSGRDTVPGPGGRKDK